MPQVNYVPLIASSGAVVCNHFVASVTSEQNECMKIRTADEMKHTRTIQFHVALRESTTSTIEKI